MILAIFTDGASKGNPGRAGIGIVAFVDGDELFTHKEFIGIATNNVAEYRAIIKALELVRDKIKQDNLSVDIIAFNADSQLVVSQLNGIYKVKHADMRDLLMKIRVLEGEIGIPVSYTYIPREKNRRADALVNEAL